MKFGDIEIVYGTKYSHHTSGFVYPTRDEVIQRCTSSSDGKVMGDVVKWVDEESVHNLIDTADALLSWLKSQGIEAPSAPLCRAITELREALKL